MDNTENVLNAGVVVDGNLSGCVSCISELGDTVLGQFCLGFPFIWMKTTNSIKKILTDSICKRISTDEQEDCFVFTHELIHAIQAVCFPVAQIPFARALMRVYDIRHTAEERIKAKTVVFDPLIVSGYSDDVARIEREIFGNAVRIRLDDGSVYLFTARDILEGSARLLETAYRGAPARNDKPPYTTVQQLNEQIFHDKKLSEKELLDVCEIALSKNRPAQAFLLLCLSIKSLEMSRDKNFYRKLRGVSSSIGVDDLPDILAQDKENIKSILGGNALEGFSENTIRFMDEVRAFFGDGPVMSSLYDMFRNDKGYGLPNALLAMMGKSGSPASVNGLGIPEQFSKRDPQPVDQNAHGIVAVVDSIIHRRGCKLLPQCRAAVREGTTLPVDKLCSMAPWKKEYVEGRFACPYQVIWKTFGLCGLSLRDKVDPDMATSSYGNYNGDVFMEIKLTGLKGFDTWIRTNDGGNLAHFHLEESGEDGKKFKTCIRLDEAKYFHHGPYTSVLNAKQRKQLKGFLSSPSKKDKGKTNWQVLVDEWNRNNSTTTLPSTLVMPDYSNIAENLV